jgi:hypothetical protein
MYGHMYTYNVPTPGMGGIEHLSQYATAGRKGRLEGATTGPTGSHVVCGNSWRLPMWCPLHTAARAKVFVFHIFRIRV